MKIGGRTMEQKCPICGKKTSSYIGNVRKDWLCREHAKQLKEGKIIKCENCGSIIKSDEPCPNCDPVSATVIIDSQNTCITCGERTDGYHFCKVCYNKYKDKNIIVNIAKCKEAKILEEDYYNTIYKTEDGHLVKSKDEVIIDNLLFSRRIFHQYEKPFYSKDGVEITPDWTLPQYKDLGDVIIEYWGITNDEKYEESKKYKLDIYKKEGVTLISIEQSEIKNLAEILERKLKTAKKGKINSWVN